MNVIRPRSPDIVAYTPPLELSEEEMAPFLEEAKKMPPLHKAQFEQIIRNLFARTLTNLESRRGTQPLNERIKDAKKTFSIEAKSLLETKKEAIALEKIEQIGKATGREYLEAFGRGAMNGLSHLVEDVLHPIDRVVIPFAQFLHDTGLANAPLAHFHIEAPGYSEVIARDPIKSTKAKIAQDQRIDGVVEQFKYFAEASGPKRVEIIASIFTPSLALGYVGHVAQSIRGAQSFTASSASNHKYSAIKFNTSEGGKGYARLATSTEEGVFKIHLDLLQTEHHPLGGSTPPAGVLPTMIKISQQLAREAGAEKIHLQGFFVNEKLLNVLHQGYPYLGVQPFFHKGIQGPSSVLFHEIFDPSYQRHSFHTFEIPLGKRMPVNNPPLQ